MKRENKMKSLNIAKIILEKKREREKIA